MTAPQSVLGGAGRYIHVGFLQISWANFVVILLMVVVFVLALLIPMGRRHSTEPDPTTASERLDQAPDEGSSR
jgi:hypothetical protein